MSKKAILIIFAVLVLLVAGISLVYYCSFIIPKKDIAEKCQGFVPNWTDFIDCQGVVSINDGWDMDYISLKDHVHKYEIARIIGTRALQIAMDAPILLKLSKDELEKIKYEALQIAEMEFKEGVLPITIHRPTPRRGKEKIGTLKEESTSDEELIEKAKEVEQEIVENPEEYSLVEEEEELSIEPTSGSEEA